MNNSFICSTSTIFINPVLSKYYFSDIKSEISNITYTPINPYNCRSEPIDISSLRIYVNKNKKVHIFISTSMILGDNMIDILSELQRLEVKKIIIHIPVSCKSLLRNINNDIEKLEELSVKILIKVEHFKGAIEFWTRWEFNIYWHIDNMYTYVNYDYDSNKFKVSSKEYSYKERCEFIKKRKGNNKNDK